MRVTTTISSGPRSTELDGLTEAIESHPIWTELRGPDTGDNPTDNSDPTGMCPSFLHSLCVVASYVSGYDSYEALTGCLDSGTQSDYDCAVMTFDPAYAALRGYSAEAQASRDGCPLSTVAADGLQGTLGLVGTVALAAGVGEGLGGAADTGAGDLAETCANSFTADTPVTLADGKQEPIKDVKVGEKVLATDPYTGQTKAEPVVALIRHTGRHTMVLVTLADGSVLDATSGHKIWDATRHTFVDASGLHVGDQIETDSGALITVAALTDYSANLTAYNLQISTIHTYYAGTTPVLVHNSCTAASVLQDPSALESLTPSQVDDLAQNAGYDISAGKAGAANPATRYYVPGTNGSVGFRVLPGGVAGQAGVKGSTYLRFFGGPNAGIRIPLTPP